MSNGENKYWFMIVDELFENAYCIFCAESEDELTKSIGSLAEGKRVVQLDWDALSHFIGCVIPCQYKSKDFAQGSLMFMHKGRFVTITCGIFTGY